MFYVITFIIGFLLGYLFEYFRERVENDLIVEDEEYISITEKGKQWLKDRSED